MATRISNPAIQHFDKGTRAQLSGGQLFFFEPNASTTPKDTFADSAETTANANPVILDANGFEPDIFGIGSYRIVLQNSNGLQQWERDPVDFEIDTGAFSDWLSTVSYGTNDIVKGSDDNFWIAIQPSFNDEPQSSPAFWTQFDLLKRYNANETYEEDDIIRSSEGILYNSVTSSNQGNSPDLDFSGINWVNKTKLLWLSGVSYDIDDTVKASDNNYYYSIVSTNLGRDPITPFPTHWQQYYLYGRRTTFDT